MQMKLENKMMLITYADSLGENLTDLQKNLATHFKDAVGGIHLLPFFLQQVIVVLPQSIIQKSIPLLELGTMLKR